MPVGSTNTIIYSMFRENNIEIPSNIAGLMLSGIISDTLILKSPTATSKDIAAVQELANIAEVNYIDYGMAMLKAGTSLDGMSKADVLYNDFKLYTVNGRTFVVYHKGKFLAQSWIWRNGDLLCLALQKRLWKAK